MKKQLLIDVSRVDWKLLRKQKKELLKIEDSPRIDMYTENACEELDKDLITGVISLLDDIQDQAALQIGVKRVFEVLK